MERPIFQPVGTPQEELDTPALVVDLDVMTRNMDTVHRSFDARTGDMRGWYEITNDVWLRPHMSCHGCPDIGWEQMRSLDWHLVDTDYVGVPTRKFRGIAVNTLGEAETFASAGFEEILITGRVVTKSKILRLCALCKSNDTSVALAVDNPRNVHDLAEAFEVARESLRVVVDIDAGYGRGGVASGLEALELAQFVAATCPSVKWVELRGLMSHEGPMAITDRAELEAETRRRLQPVVDTRELLEREGLPVEMVSVGSTYNYDIAQNISGVTEVQAGAYPLMDAETCRIRPELAPAARVLATVISHPVPGRAVLDAGHKAMAPDFGLPTLDGMDGATATRFSAEHGILELEEQAWGRLMPEDKAWLVPHNLALCVNQFDYIRAVRGGKLVGYWPIAARGRLD